MKYVYTVEHNGHNTGGALAVTKGWWGKYRAGGAISAALFVVKCPVI